ncbi:MAG: squalene--hopene cyclase, partial [Verrucomicrobiota bacterium]
MPDKDSLDALRQELERRLQAARHAEGCWRGRLSSSALANALACIALRDAPSDADSRVAVERGIGWLCDHRNADGGWGDTPNSPSNLTTTLLCRAALRHCGVRRNSRVADSARASAAWTAAVCGAAEGSALAPFVRKQYGRDRTFAAPILAICAHTGLLGENGWRVVPSLPYALALAPAPLYRFLHLSVVSYALPALIAVGLMIDCGRCHRGSTLRAALRRKIAPRLVKKLTAMQPSSGGFLEAIPLTAFVAIGLTAAGHGASLAVAACTDFLRTGQRQDGSWPIDTDLATWLTAEAVKALPANDEIDADEHNQTVAWLLDQQFNAPHPFTRAAPGGWGWTDHPGAVPDADDTAGVLLALHRLAPDAPEANAAAKRGIEWLLNLQNRDGGIPTFCRGWGRLPFDRSCPDITAHAAAAVAQWLPRQNNLVRNRAARFLRRSLAYLRKTQAANGSWTPLWFGNQAGPNHANPVFGTARVLCALAIPATQSLLQTPHSRRG